MNGDKYAYSDQMRRALDALEMVIRSCHEYDDDERDETVRGVRRMVGSMRTKVQKLEAQS